MSFLLDTLAIGIPIFLVLLALLLVERARAFKRGESNIIDYLAFRELSARGISLDEPLSTLFGFFVPTQPSAEHLVNMLGPEYSCEIEPGGIDLNDLSTGLAESREGWLVYARRTLIVDGLTIANLRQRFDTLARSENGLFLGWKVAPAWGPPGERISAQASPGAT